MAAVFGNGPKPGDIIAVCNESGAIAQGPYKIISAFPSKEDFDQLRYQVVDKDGNVPVYKPRSSFIGSSILAWNESVVVIPKEILLEKVLETDLKKINNFAVQYIKVWASNSDIGHTFDPENDQTIMTWDEVRAKYQIEKK